MSESCEAAGSLLARLPGELIHDIVQVRTRSVPTAVRCRHPIALLSEIRQNSPRPCWSRLALLSRPLNTHGSLHRSRRCRLPASQRFQKNPRFYIRSSYVIVPVSIRTCNSEAAMRRGMLERAAPRAKLVLGREAPRAGALVVPGNFPERSMRRILLFSADGECGRSS